MKCYVFFSRSEFWSKRNSGDYRDRNFKTCERKKSGAVCIDPSLFAVQQAAEGALWIALSGDNGESWKYFPLYIFLIFAQLVWPVWIPFSVLRLEHDRTRATILKWILGMGICVSLYLMYCLFAYKVSAEIQSRHILYSLRFPTAFTWIVSMFYFVPTVVPLFVSSTKKIQLLGLAVLASFVFSMIYFSQHLISVWCFFAGIISLVIFWIVLRFKKHEQLSNYWLP
jgi:hypothetical protein